MKKIITALSFAALLATSGAQAAAYGTGDPGDPGGAGSGGMGSGGSAGTTGLNSFFAGEMGVAQFAPAVVIGGVILAAALVISNEGDGGGGTGTSGTSGTN